MIPQVHQYARTWYDTHRVTRLMERNVTVKVTIATRCKCRCRRTTISSLHFLRSKDVMNLSLGFQPIDQKPFGIDYIYIEDVHLPF